MGRLFNGAKDVIEERVGDAKVDIWLEVVVVHMSPLLLLEEPIFGDAMVYPEVSHVIDEISNEKSDKPRITPLSAKDLRDADPEWATQDESGDWGEDESVKVHGGDVVMAVDEEVDDVSVV